jgi:hypothetical protein
VNEELVKGEMRRLLLPIRPELEVAALDAARLALDQGGVDPADHAAFLRAEYAQWRDVGSPGKAFAAAVKAYLQAGEPQFGPVLSKKYFDMHSKLSRKAQFDHDLASSLLSHARLIAALAVEDRLSSAQIAQLLSRRAPRLPSSWIAVEIVLRAIRSRPNLTREDVEHLFDLDTTSEEATFIDAALPECVQRIGIIASEFGVPPSFEKALSELVTDPFFPYLKMLHYLCTIAEYYDHPPEFPYEFSPRGKTSAWLATRYPAVLTATGNPFLNNAKSVDVLDRSWANSKKAAQSHAAHALVTVIESLSGLGFSARRELATWIRRLLVRIIRLSAGTRVVLPTLGPTEISRIITAVSRGPTNSFGILEQRVVDALGFLRYEQPVWVARGLGDSVNATNVSKRKCGDCDFQDGVGRKVAAFEPHAGRLSDIYVKGHELTLKRVLAERRAEWDQTVGLGGKWSVSVMFVAHEVPSDQPLATVTVKDVTAEISAVTFEEFVDGLDVNSPEVQVAFEEYVRQQLMEDRTPESVRRLVKALIS